MGRNSGINIINHGYKLSQGLLSWVERQRYFIDKMRSVVNSGGEFMEEVRLLKVRDIMRILQLSKSTVYRMIERGEFEVVRVGRSIRIKESSVERYFDEKK